MQIIQCAIYVRKSTERGLEQEFNSLDNQEQACKNYILSQTFQGWEYFKTYSDAAISGGTMARPGLKQMLTDIRAGKIQCVLVYKIDRLSRSIYDFKTMMKNDFEPHDCNLVSITQSFDTSNAMGKLTLNMLLSFAEFEREVASERVRDKMRATKAKGVWVGGVAPLGYDLKFGKLVPNESEIPIVREIFNTYLESTSFLDCKDKIATKGICGKKWFTKNGEEKGGKPITANIVERILKNQIYLGKLPNKSTGEVFDGLHPAILDKELFDRVQQKIADNNNHPNAPYRRGTPLLHQKIYTADGTQLKNKKGNKKFKQYRYYKTGRVSLPAGDIEAIVCNLIKEFLDSDMACLSKDKQTAFKQVRFSEPLVRDIIDRIVYANNKLTVFINVGELEYLRPYQQTGYINQNNKPMSAYLTTDGKYMVLEKEIFISSNTCINCRHDGCERELLTRDENALILTKALAYGWKYKKEYENGVGIKELAKTAGRDQRTIYKYLNLAYLSPRIINDIMDGKIPTGINLQKLFQIASKYDKFTDQERVCFC